MYTFHFIKLGKVHSTSYEGKHPRYKPIAEDVTEAPVFPEGGGDEYGKEIDDSFETFLNLRKFRFISFFFSFLF